MIARPSSFRQVLDTFGNIYQYIRKDGTLSPSWEREKIVRIPLPQPIPLYGNPALLVTKLTAHRLIADQLAATMQDINDCRLWPLLKSYGGGFVFRPIRGQSDHISLHSFGVAWDFNPETNPLGMVGDMPQELVTVFERHGFFWGGKFVGRKDFMHYQYAVNC